MIPPCPRCGHVIKASEAVTRDGWTVNLYSGAWYQGQRIKLHPQAIAIMHRLMSTIGACSKAMLATACSSRGELKVIDVVIARTRQLMKQSGSPRFIETVYGNGYEWVS